MPAKLNVVVVDDHLSIVDGYIARLSRSSDIEVVATAYYGEDLETVLSHIRVDVLILDVSLPTSPENRNPYPILYAIPRLLETYPDLAILIISMFSNRTLIRSVMEAGASGYLLKDDQAEIRDLAAIIRIVAGGGVYLSQTAYQQYNRDGNQDPENELSARQLEALSLSATFPEANTFDLAKKMQVAHSTLRNLLSQAYIKLQVHSRTAAVTKARQLGLLTPASPDPDLQALSDKSD